MMGSSRAQIEQHRLQAPMPFIMGLHADMEIDPEVAVGSRRALLICLPQYDCECTVAIDRGEVTLPEDMPEFPFKVNHRR